MILSACFKHRLRSSVTSLTHKTSEALQAAQKHTCQGVCCAVFCLRHVQTPTWIVLMLQTPPVWCPKVAKTNIHRLLFAK